MNGCLHFSVLAAASLSLKRCAKDLTLARVMTMRIIHSADPLNDPAVAAVRDRLRAGGLTASGTGPTDIPSVVRDLIADVQRRGDAAIAECTNRIHKTALAPGGLRIAPEAIVAARRQVEREDPKFFPLMRKAIRNIRQYQEHIKTAAPGWLKRGSRRLGVRYTPLDRVAVHVPGWRALYPSSVLMLVVPAQVAGVREIVMVSPPGQDGRISPMALALADLLGLTEVYCMAGVPGLAGLALGTKTIRPVDKIVGPGNAFVAETKRQLFGRVGIDSIAGPSEVLIVADETAPAEWVAADMLAQAEHDPGSAVLVTTSARLAEAVAAEIERQLATLERAEAARAGIETNGAILVVPRTADAIAVANAFATEHLQIVTKNAEAVLAKIRHAGAIFLGPHTPVPLGDYFAGPSHVLPTGGTARFFSALSCNDFLKASSLIQYSAAALEEDASDVAAFARREGLTAHARAVEARSRRGTESSETSKRLKKRKPQRRRGH
jgi:histidinol dehydrogenase